MGVGVNGTLQSNSNGMITTTILVAEERFLRRFSILGAAAESYPHNFAEWPNTLTVELLIRD